MDFKTAITLLENLASYNTSLINNDNEKEFLQLMLDNCKKGSKVEIYLIDILTNDFTMIQRCGYFSTSYEYWTDNTNHKNTWIAIAKLADKTSKIFAKSQFKKAYRSIRAGKQPKSGIERKAIKARFKPLHENIGANVLFKHFVDSGFDWSRINMINRTIKIHGRHTKIFNY